MAKKKKAAQVSSSDAVALGEKQIAGESTSAEVCPPPHPRPSPSIGPNSRPCSTSTLIICRNKHWRYISSFHGPWLQLPPEILESIACSNFYLPRPQLIDPACLFDLVKIRRLVDDATDLAVRAASGTTSSALHSLQHANYGLFGGGSAAALGLGVGGGHGANAKLSKERKSRMREHATQKLSHAYHLDEIAASVATMQSASALEDVAKHVLTRNPTDPDAKYVHFFHEKIPSRSLAECTSLAPLDHIIDQRPTEGSPYRTRAVTKIFKEDYASAIADLTEGLRVCRLYHAQHEIGDDEKTLVLARDAQHRTEAKVDERDQPSSLEGQLLFHRAGVYLTMACDKILPALRAAPQSNGNSDSRGNSCTTEIEEKGAAARKAVRNCAKRALRDYTAFISRFNYTPGQSAKITRAFLAKVNAVANGQGKRYQDTWLLEANDSSTSTLSRMNGSVSRSQSCSDLPPCPAASIYKLGDLFAAVPPTDIPPFPSTSNALTKPSSLPISGYDSEFCESLTYHPLLTDALHSLLLCHCLVQTSSKELLRHANMVARLTRLLDGFPIFLAARSPARADWVEVVRRRRNWLGLTAAWDTLCSPPLPPGQQSAESKETREQRRERKRKEAIRDALADERVVDEESFRRSIRAREMRAAHEEEEEIRLEYLRTGRLAESTDPDGTDGTPQTSESTGPKQPSTDEDGDDDDDANSKECPITTERAEAIARWILDAPPPGADGPTKKMRRNGAAGRSGALARSESSGLEKSVESLSVATTEGE